MVVNPRNIVIRRLEEDNTFHIYFPQTLVDGFQDKDDVYKTHWTDMNVHVSNEDRVNVFNKSVVLDQDGRVPENILSKAQRLKVKDFANFAALKEAYAAKTVSDNEYVMVTDASDKPTDPHTGWEITAIIPPKAEGGEPTFRAISTSQLVDYVVSANTIEGRYTSTSEQIDALVANDHTHANLAVLDTLTEDTFKQLAKKQDFQAVKYGENAIAMDNAEGDMIFNVTGILADPTTPTPPPVPPAAPEEHHEAAATTGDGTSPAAPAPTGSSVATGSEDAPLRVESQPVTPAPAERHEEPAAAATTGNTETSPAAPPTAATEGHRDESTTVNTGVTETATPAPTGDPTATAPEGHREETGAPVASPSEPPVAAEHHEEPAAAATTGNSETAPATAQPTPVAEERHEEPSAVTAEHGEGTAPAAPAASPEEHREQPVASVEPQPVAAPPTAAPEEHREEPATASAEHGETTSPAAPPVASPTTPEEHHEESGNVSAEPQPAVPPTAAPEEHHENPTGEGTSPVASPATSEEHREETATTVNAGDAETTTPAPTGAPTATGSEEAPSHVESQPVEGTHTPEESAPQA